LGVTVNVAVFSVVDRLLFRPLPYADSARLVQLHQFLIPGNDDSPTSSGIFGEVSQDIAERTHAFSGVAWAEGFPVRTAVAAGEPPLVFGVATSNILDVLGVRPVLGRSFVPSDATAPTRSVVLAGRSLGAPVRRRRRCTRRTVEDRARVLPGDRRPVAGFLLPSSRFMEQCDGLFTATGMGRGLARTTTKPPVTRYPHIDSAEY
jgi:hypothetical protein